MYVFGKLGLKTTTVGDVTIFQTSSANRPQYQQTIRTPPILAEDSGVLHSRRDSLSTDGTHNLEQLIEQTSDH